MDFPGRCASNAAAVGLTPGQRNKIPSGTVKLKKKERNQGSKRSDNRSTDFILLAIRLKTKYVWMYLLLF